MKPREPRTRKLTQQEVRDIIGDLDDAKIAAILATGSSLRSSRKRPLGLRGRATSWATLSGRSMAWSPGCTRS